MSYAVIKTGGKQYKVAVGDILEVEHLKDAQENADVAFSEVLLVADGENISVGSPLVSQVTVTAKVLGHTQGDKIRVVKFKAKSRYRRVTGHRQQLTRVQIAAIGQAKKAEKTNDTQPAKKTAAKAAK